MQTKIQWLTPLGAGLEIGVAPQTVVSWARKGIIESIVTSGGGRLFSRSEVLRVKQERAQSIAATKEELAYTDRAAAMAWAKSAREAVPA